MPELAYGVEPGCVGLGTWGWLSDTVTDDNRLESLSADETMPRLRTLRVSDNRLGRLEVGAFGNVRTLYADNNRLCEVRGCSRLRKLENLSLRHQGGKGL